MESNTFFLQINQSLANLRDKLSNWIDEIVLMIPNLVLALAIMVITFLLMGFISRVLRKTLKRVVNNKAMINLLTNIGSVLFVLAALIVVLAVLNLDQALFSLLAGAGVAGLAVGLALQDPLVNLFSSILISARNKNYNIGDLVETNGFLGTIEEIDLRTTTLRSAQGNSIIIPNKKIVQDTLTNYSVSGNRKVELLCGISYHDDLEKVQEIAIKTICNQFDQSIPELVDFYYTNFGDSSIDFVLRYPLSFDKKKNFMLARSQSIVALKKAFDKAGIDIPFPIRTLDLGEQSIHLAQAEQIKIIPSEISSN
ncbi:MAG: small-conductance mechanosensitive channel MscS [Saprospiraceae bacterium]